MKYMSLCYLVNGHQKSHITAFISYCHGDATTETVSSKILKVTKIAEYKPKK